MGARLAALLGRVSSGAEKFDTLIFTFPYAGASRIRFKGSFSARTQRAPLTTAGQDTGCGWVWQGAQALAVQAV
jgi:hypothetical protein